MDFSAYAGRLVDISVLGGISTGGAAYQPSPRDGLVIAGVLKLCQRFVLSLFTTRGSIIGLPDKGCDFMPLLRSGSLRTDYDVEAAFSASVADIAVQLAAEETAETPADEVFSSATLVSVLIDDSRRAITLTTTINSAAGVARTILLPLSNLVGG